MHGDYKSEGQINRCSRRLPSIPLPVLVLHAGVSCSVNILTHNLSFEGVHLREVESKKENTGDGAATSSRKYETATSSAVTKSTLWGSDTTWIDSSY